MKKNLVLFLTVIFCFGSFNLLFADTIKIGVHGPMTGPAAEVGRYIKNGALIAADEINEKGGVLGKKIELIFGDTESKPEVGVSVLERFMTKDKVDLIVGGLHSSVNIAMEEAAAKYGKIFVTGGPVSEILSDRVKNEPDKYWFFFKTAPAYSEMKSSYRTFFKYLKENNLFTPKSKKIVAIVEDTDYGRGLAASFEEAMNEDGWKLAATEVVKIDQADFSAQMSKLRVYNPDVLYTVQTSPAAAASLCKSFYQSGIQAFFLAIYTPSNPEYINLTGKASDTLVWASSIDWVPAYAKNFLGKYRARFNEDPGQNAGIQYDAIMNVAAAIDLAKSTEPKKIAEAMVKIKNKGTMGIYQYDPTSHVAVSGEEFIPVWFSQIIDGKHYKIYPDEFKERPYTSQKWLK
jgi:branched-chain amino acid transport system substrate-binding protein